MGDAGEAVEESPPPLASSLLKLTILEMTTGHAAASSKMTGLATLRQPGVSAALRSAMHLAGDIDTPLPSEQKSRVAERYIHSRIVVDEHTAGALLLEAFSQSKVFILRNFPGALPPALESVSALLRHPPTGDSVAYTFNDRGSRVHYVFTSLSGDSPQARAARDWWRDINQLPDVGKEADMSAGTQWNFISRRGMSSLHMDTADGTNTQHRGKKLWVLVRADEAEQQGIVPLTSDAMRDVPAGTHRLSAWLACDSFQWCVMDEGDTLLLPRDRLHAVCCIGDMDAVSSGAYCWLQGTPPLPAEFLQPKKSRKRKDPPPPSPPRSPSPSPLPMVKRAKAEATSPHHSPIQRVVAATLIADGQPAATAAAKAATSVSAAHRWSKRLQTAPSAGDAPRNGRPRSTDALEDAAIVRASELDHFATAKDIRHQLALPVSADTVGRRLDAAGLPSRVAARKRHYTEKQRRTRLSFARGYQHWTAEDWEKVIISDEVTIEGEGRNRHVRVRRPEGHRFDPEYTVHSRIYAPSIHIFACFCSRGPGRCEKYEGKLKGKSLLGLLQRTVKQTAADYYQTDPLNPRHEQWWFLHDNSKPFTSKVVQTWIFNNQINVLEWPPHSPDLNPIENLWPRVHALTDKLHPTSKEALADAFKACWQELPLDIFSNFAQSMPARIAACIAANGDATKY
jgi:transposase